MQSHVQILTTPTADTPGTGLMLVFEDKRYFFGQAHEGFQRAGLQNGAKFIKLKEIFLTGTMKTENVGGLFGLILTTADALKSRLDSDRENLRLAWIKYEQRIKEEEERKARGQPLKGKIASYVYKSPPKEVKAQRLGIHGAQNLKHFIATARSYLFRREVPLDVEELTDYKTPLDSEDQGEPTWSDEHIRVWAIALSPGVDSASPPPPSVMGHSRKRSLEEYIGGGQDEPTQAGEQILESKDPAEHPVDPADVIREMFHSKWQPGLYEEQNLRDVILPAKLCVRDPETKKLHVYKGPLPGGTEPVADIKVYVRKPWPGALYTTLPQVKPSTAAISYIVRNRKQRGKFRPDLAKSFGIKIGPDCAGLANGIPMTSPTGELITPEMVTDPGKEGAGFVVIDLPSKEYIPAFIQRSEWDDSIVMKDIKAFIWILGPGVAGEESLSKFMENHAELKHIVSSPDLSPNHLAMKTAAVAAVRNRTVDPARFASLHFSNEVPLKSSKTVELMPDAEIAKPGSQVHLAPLFKIQDDEVEVVNLEEVLKSVPSTVHDLIKQARMDIANAEKEQNAIESNLPFPDAEITCLGTGSAAPSPYRNVSGTLLRIPGHGSYLFDAGENTLGQLRRRYSPQEMAEIFRDLKMIWNSHLHADHHLGIIPVIKAWHEEVHGESLDCDHFADEQPVQRVIDHIKNNHCLFVVCGSDLKRSIYERGWTEPVCHSRQLIFLEPEYATWPDFKESRLLYGKGDDVGLTTSEDDIKSAMRNALGLSNLVVCPLSHCVRAMAISISFANGFKFSYSGDCRPTTNFARMGSDSTVLVHEATFDDELQKDAVAKKHSTISEAIQVGVRMRARNIVLTHFSQRFSKIPSMDEVVVKEWASPELVGQDENVDGNPIDEMPLDDTDLFKDQHMEGDDVQPEGQQSTSQSDLPLTEHTSPTHTSDLTDVISPSGLSNKDELSSAHQGRNSPSLDPPQFSSAHSPDINVAVAFDYMSVKVKDIQYLKHFIPAFRELYKEEEKHPVEANNAPNPPSEEAGAVQEPTIADANDVGNTGSSVSQQPPKGMARVREKEARKADKRRILEEQKRAKDEAKAKRMEMHQQRQQEQQRRAKATSPTRQQAEQVDVSVEPEMDVDVDVNADPGTSEAETSAAAVGTMSVSGP